MAVLVPPEVSTHGGYEDTKNNKMRMIIASRLTQSKREVPHFYTSVEVELDQILALRKVLAKKHDIKVSVNDLIIRCSAMALRDVPEVNFTFNAKTSTVERQHTIDISVAVATPTGLITPIVPRTDTLGLADIASEGFGRPCSRWQITTSRIPRWDLLYFQLGNVRN
jgi:pyruvate dehydrogenase E2 component (dihydrolipoamide acetyltransferase)